MKISLIEDSLNLLSWFRATILIVLAIQCINVRAELSFRVVERVDGQQRWSDIKKYSNPSDIAYTGHTATDTTGFAQEVRVILSGEITRRDVESAEVMASLVQSGKQNISGNIVWLSSFGGDIDAGMDLARLFRKLRVFTYVKKNDLCVSACVFAFMGGERRSVAGQLGIHRPFFPYTQDTADRPAKFRHMEKVLKDFVVEMDFPDSLYEAVMIVPPESVHIVNPGELRRYYLEGISPSSEDMVDAAAARQLNISMITYLQRKAKVPACAFFEAGEGRCGGRVMEAVPITDVSDNLGSEQKNETMPSGRKTGPATTNALAAQTPRRAIP